MTTHVPSNRVQNKGTGGAFTSNTIGVAKVGVNAGYLCAWAATCMSCDQDAVAEMHVASLMLHCRNSTILGVSQHMQLEGFQACSQIIAQSSRMAGHCQSHLNAWQQTSPHMTANSSQPH